MKSLPVKTFQKKFSKVYGDSKKRFEKRKVEDLNLKEGLNGVEVIAQAAHGGSGVDDESDRNHGRISSKAKFETDAEL